VALPHDWLTWKILGTGRLEDLVTDRSDASGTGYFDPVTNEYRRDILAAAL
ncbi:MAG: xylulose kinase, partial [Propionibacteriaceae bacterium]|nr:xylulose kinase [Propionibacteriaceae bacterium]